MVPLPPDCGIFYSAVHCSLLHPLFAIPTDVDFTFTGDGSPKRKVRKRVKCEPWAPYAVMDGGREWMGQEQGWVRRSVGVDDATLFVLRVLHLPQVGA